MDDCEQWMREQFPDREPEPAEEVHLTSELMALLERHNLPHQAVLLVVERVMPVFRAMGRIHTLADRFEGEGVTRPGFRQELEALVVRHITMGTQDAL
jgi:hypothetical protein